MSLEKATRDAMIHFKGSCACGRITYSCCQIPTASQTCHCITCRKLSDGAFQAYTDISVESLTLYDNKEKLKYGGLPKNDVGGITYLRLSHVADRAYYIDCHSPIAMRYNNSPDDCGITMGSIDEDGVTPEAKKALVLRMHIFAEQNSWSYDVKQDGLPYHDRFSGNIRAGFESVGG